jgi:hypothetical protein
MSDRSSPLCGQQRSGLTEDMNGGLLSNRLIRKSAHDIVHILRRTLNGQTCDGIDTKVGGARRELQHFIQQTEASASLPAIRSPRDTPSSGTKYRCFGSM